MASIERTNKGPVVNEILNRVFDASLSEDEREDLVDELVNESLGLIREDLVEYERLSMPCYNIRPTSSGPACYQTKSMRNDWESSEWWIDLQAQARGNAPRTTPAMWSKFCADRAERFQNECRLSKREPSRLETSSHGGLISVRDRSRYRQVSVERNV